MTPEAWENNKEKITRIQRIHLEMVCSRDHKDLVAIPNKINYLLESKTQQKIINRLYGERYNKMTKTTNTILREFNPRVKIKKDWFSKFNISL